MKSGDIEKWKKGLTVSLLPDVALLTSHTDFLRAVMNLCATLSRETLQEKKKSLHVKEGLDIKKTAC